MPKPTSREGQRTRERDPSAPTARYVGRALLTAGKRPADLAQHLGVSRGLITQWLNGQTFPPADKLIEISLWSRLSLGVLSAMAAERRSGAGKFEGDIESRIGQLPGKLREAMLDTLTKLEATAHTLPAEIWREPVSNEVLEQREWAAPGSPTAKRVAERRAKIAAISTVRIKK